jgi:hypothetical protein
MGRGRDLCSARLTSEAIQENVQVIDPQLGEITDNRQLHLPHDWAMDCSKGHF